MKRGKNDTSVSCQSLRRLTVTTPRILRIFRDAWPPGRPGKKPRNVSARRSSSTSGGSRRMDPRSRAPGLQRSM